MLRSGDRFGDYTVVRQLGKGGMGAVYLLETADGAQVAAKILDPETAGDHESRAQFLREAELALGGSSDPDDPHVSGRVPVEVRSKFAVLKEEKLARLAKVGIRQLPDNRWFVGTSEVCTKKPNGWGLYDLLGNVDEMLLDTFPLENPDGSYRRNGENARSGVTYQPQEKDPLRLYGKSDVIGMVRSSLDGYMRARKYLLPSVRVPAVGFRLVLGPDLEKELKVGAKAGRKRR